MLLYIKLDNIYMGQDLNLWQKNVGVPKIKLLFIFGYIYFCESLFM